MFDRNLHPGVKHAAFVGMRALHGFSKAQLPAKVASQVPYFGPALGVAVLVGATVRGALEGLDEYDGE